MNANNLIVTWQHYSCTVWQEYRTSPGYKYSRHNMH